MYNPIVSQADITVGSSTTYGERGEIILCNVDICQYNELIIVVTLVSSRVGYAKSILFGVSQSNFLKLQRIQNRISKLVTTILHKTILPASISKQLCC